MGRIAVTKWLEMLDWALSIDFDPFEIIVARREMNTACASLLDEKAIRAKRGD